MASNWAVVLSYNNHHLTEAALRSLRVQDIEGGMEILVVDNASRPDTVAWLNTQHDVSTIMLSHKDSVAGCWNRALRYLFNERRESYALVVNNDVVLRPDAYRHLVADGGLFVTCVGKDDPACVAPDLIPDDPRYPQLYSEPNLANKRPHPDFSCYLIRREAWQRVGEFDERFEGAMCEDWDYHCRLHGAGIEAECIDLPFYHYGSATINLASNEERDAIHAQAQRNRAYFAEKWGFEGGSEAYYDYFKTLPPG